MDKFIPKSYHNEIAINVKASDVVKNVGTLASKAIIHKFILQANMKNFAEKNNIKAYKLINETLADFKRTNDAIFVKSINLQRNK